jgi:hypothetical protein
MDGVRTSLGDKVRCAAQMGTSCGVTDVWVVLALGQGARGGRCGGGAADPRDRR